MHVATPRGREQRPGQMTTVMRALAPPTGPKVLRVGVVHAGRVLEERVVKQRARVTIGTSETASFVVLDAGLPPEWTLFEVVGDDYCLNLREGMGGRVAQDDAVRELGDLRAHARAIRGGHQLRLTDDARGKVVVGATTFLFQLASAAVQPGRPQLPLAIKAGLASQVDWSLTIIAAFSFLLHFGVIGAMYSDWMDSVVDTSTTASGIVDLMAHIPDAPLDVPRSTAPTLPSDAPRTPEAAPPRAPVKDSASRATTSPSEAAALSARATKLEMELMLTLGGDSALRGVLSREEIPPVDLGRAAESASGVAASTGNGLHFGPGATAIRPGEMGTSLAKIGTTHTDGTIDAGRERTVAGPIPSVSIESTSGGAAVPNAGAVVANLKAGFRSCYNAGLRGDPTMAGRVTLSAKIGPNGAVATTTPSGNAGLSAGVVECLVKRVANAQFDAPGPAGATLQIPITFLQQPR